MTTKKQKAPAAVPQGFRRVTAQLVVADIDAAVTFYAAAFGAVEQDRAVMPGATAPVYARLRIGDTTVTLVAENLALGLVTPRAVGGSGVTLHQYLDTLEETFEAAIAAGARIVEPLFDTYWGDRMGVIVDPFGHRWSLARRVERVTEDEKVERLAAIYGLDVAVEAAVA